ncbi:type III pantothenate kinase [Dyadobacter sp. UP-52]|uniref:Type III pantothenate kinase n=2 Tax=Dyadobacter subterraneus TaxID=2773304 RepID=A0ABR9WFQ2_9BACT|nr:type III pantothenate kinase [Dyadobacter subterraneus]
MNVVVDSGNTYSKIGWFSGDNLIRYETRLGFTELIDLIRAELPERIIYSSVNRPLNEFLEALDRDVPVLNLTGVTTVPVQKDYETPHTLGADRIAAACGANWMFPGKDVLVIDMGTSITYDMVDQQGIFRGGLISPGVRMRFNALHTFTKRLPLFDPEKDPEFIGKSTKNAIQSGVMNGTLAEIEGIINRYRNEIPSLCVVICGGDVPFFESSLKPPIFAVPELVLIGLNRILTYNVALQ